MLGEFGEVGGMGLTLLDVLLVVDMLGRKLYFGGAAGAVVVTAAEVAAAVRELLRGTAV